MVTQAYEMKLSGFAESCTNSPRSQLLGSNKVGVHSPAIASSISSCLTLHYISPIYGWIT